MQYGDLIARSLSIVWRHKYLWLLAILGGADVTIGGFGSNFGGAGNTFNSGRSSSGGAGNPAGLQDAATAAGQFVQDNVGLLLALGAVVLAVGVAWWLLSCVTTGSLVRATAEHDAERPFGLGPAWRTGLSTFGAILGLRLLGLVWLVLVLGVIGALVALGVASYASGQGAALGLVIGLGILVFVVLLVASIPVGIVFILGTRAAVLEQRGPVSALGRGVELLRARLGRVLLVWLLQVGLALAAGLGLAIVLVPVVLIGVVMAVGAGAASGVGAAVVVAIPLVLLLIVLSIILGGIVGAYLSTYWTLAFRRMEIDAPRPVAWPQAPYGAR